MGIHNYTTRTIFLQISCRTLSCWFWVFRWSIENSFGQSTILSYYLSILKWTSMRWPLWLIGVFNYSFTHFFNKLISTLINWKLIPILCVTNFCWNFHWDADGPDLISVVFDVSIWKLSFPSTSPLLVLSYSLSQCVCVYMFAWWLVRLCVLNV